MKQRWDFTDSTKNELQQGSMHILYDQMKSKFPRKNIEIWYEDGRVEVKVKDII